MTSPDGNNCAAICMMQEKAQQWINVVNEWFLLKVQLFPRVCHGLCSSTATFMELEHALNCQYYQILPLGWVVCMTTIKSRTVDAGFYGVGLPHLGVKALVAMLNKLLMHYGCQPETGRFMQTSLSLLFVELGLLFQPLQKSYKQFGFLTTHSWFKMLWEKLSKFGVRVAVAELPKKYGYFFKPSLCQTYLQHQDIRSTRKYYHTNPQMRCNLACSGPQSSQQMWLHLWRNAILSICLSRSRAPQVGRFMAPNHKIWRWT